MHLVHLVITTLARRDSLHSWDASLLANMKTQECRGEVLKEDYEVDQADTTESAGRVTVLSTEPLDWPLWTKVLPLAQRLHPSLISYGSWSLLKYLYLQLLEV